MQVQPLMQVVEGKESERNLSLGLRVPESDRGVEIIIFG
jgi:hypothetical protein